MKKIFLILSILLLSMTGCKRDTAQIKHNIQFYDTFDTVIEVTIFSEDKDFAEENLQFAQDRFEELHKLFDRYHNYRSDKKEIPNVKTINDKAGKEPVFVSEDLYEMIKFSKEAYNTISHKTNICLGPLVDYWNQYRDLYEGGASSKDVEEQLGYSLPPQEELEALRPLMDMNELIVDDKNHTVFLTKEGMSLDTGAVAKGYATELVARDLEKRGVTSAMISAGGNVRLIGKPMGDRQFFRVGIQNPDTNSSNQVAEILDVNGVSVVTSGDYQRYFDLAGKRYCHILDPDTLYPTDHIRSMTVVTKDSGLCDFLSTAAFLSNTEDIMAMAKQTQTDMLWIDRDLKVLMTPGMSKYLEDDHAK
ncbi:MAG: FAD:protein FMN transferase [Tissierellia bacterium]|nr:FAD:protein FMN transferase [Tissierellia bacterium]